MRPLSASFCRFNPISRHHVILAVVLLAASCAQEKQQHPELPLLSQHRPTRPVEQPASSVSLPKQLPVSGLVRTTQPVAQTVVHELPIQPPVPHPAHQLAPLTGGLLTLLDHGEYVASDPDYDSVWLIGPTDTPREIQLAPGALPGQSVVSDDQVLYVALRGAGAIGRVDLKTLTALERIDVCPSPQGLAYRRTDPFGTDPLLIVACADGQLITLDPATDQIVHHFQLEEDLRDVVVEGDIVFVSRFRTAQVLILNLSDGVFERQVPPTPANFAPTVAWRLVQNPTGGALLAHQLSSTAVVHVNPGTPAGMDPGTPAGMDPSTQPPLTDCSSQAGYGPPLLDCGQGAGTDEGFGTPVSCSTGVVAVGVTLFQRDQLPSFQGTVIGVVPPVDMVAGEQVSILGIGSQNLFTTTLGTAITDEAGLGPCLLTNSTAGQDMPGVTSIAPSASSSTDVASFRRARGIEPARFSRDLTSEGSALLTEGPLGDDRGRELFYQATPSTMSCASCHPDGRDDGHTWNFDPMGLRRTPSLGGGLLATAPFHWDGAEKDISQLMTDVFVGRMGAAPPSSDDVAALSAWLDSVSVTHAAEQQEPQAVARGKVLFETTAGCTACHSGEHFTNNQTLDVGTGGAFQVPTLLGVGSRAPYLHTGCAATLRDRFTPTCGGGDLHGNTSHLSSGQIDDLVAYLKTL